MCFWVAVRTRFALKAIIIFIHLNRINIEREREKTVYLRHIFAWMLANGLANNLGHLLKRIVSWHCVPGHSADRSTRRSPIGLPLHSIIVPIVIIVTCSFQSNCLCWSFVALGPVCTVACGIFGSCECLAMKNCFWSSEQKEPIVRCIGIYARYKSFGLFISKWHLKRLHHSTFLTFDLFRHFSQTVAFVPAKRDGFLCALHKSQMPAITLLD